MGADPWSLNYFDPPAPHVAPPSPRTKAPKMLPEQDELFIVQRNILKTLRAIDDLERALGKDAGKVQKEIRSLTREAENTYRKIRSYLEKHT